MRKILPVLSLFLVGCASVKPGPAPEPVQAIEARVVAEASGEAGLYSYGTPILPVYRVTGKFTAVGTLGIPPRLDIYLEGDAVIVASTQAHIDAVTRGTVRVFRNGVPLGADAAFVRPGSVRVLPAAPPPPPPPAVWPEISSVPAIEVGCPDGKCSPK